MGMLNEKLRDLRVSRNLSQEFVAKYLGVKRTAIVEIESGKRKVSAMELGIFSELYMVSCDELLKGKTEIEDHLFVHDFSILDEKDQEEILHLIEFKKMMKFKKNEIMNL